MILELHERDTEILEQILSILKSHPEIEKFEIDEEPMVSLPGLEIFPSRRKVFRDRQEIQLTAKEYRILLLLAANKGRVLTYAQIYEQVWGDFTSIGHGGLEIGRGHHLLFYLAQRCIPHEIACHWRCAPFSKAKSAGVLFLKLRRLNIT